VAGCAACVIADAFGDSAGKSADDEGTALLSRLGSMTDVPVVMAGPSPVGAIETAVHELGLGSRRIVGSAVAAFASGVRAMVALEVGCSPSEVSLSVLGRPPRGLVVVWSDATIGGHPLCARVDSGQMSRIEARVERLWPPRPATLGLAAAELARAVVGASRRSHLVLAVLDGAFGVRHGVGVIPAVLGPSGISRTWTPQLAPRERARLLSALGDGLPRSR
jgi:malate/lactate dehydrogenase